MEEVGHCKLNLGGWGRGKVMEDVWQGKMNGGGGAGGK
jgi:hypothetical protein